MLPAEITNLDFAPLWLTFKLASVTIIVLLLIGTPIAWWLANTKRWYKPTIEAIVALPIVLPPTVLGFYLLLLLGNGLNYLAGFSLAFTFTGLVIGSTIYSLPFVVQPLQIAFEGIGKLPGEVASTLRASKWDQFWSIYVPMARRGYLTAFVLGFAHTLGEFGVVLMIGGNIPGKTKVISIAIYDLVEQLEYSAAHVLSGGMLILSFLILFVLFLAKSGKNYEKVKS